jgi:hypothetical protein
MSATALVEALAIPADARVGHRVPKKVLLEQGAPTAADKRHIQAGIEELLWVAALKPSNVGVPAYRDAVREYLEIAVLTVTLRPEAKAPRLVELIHRAIPYPLVLVATQAGTTVFTLAHKRFSQADRSQVVLDGVVSSGSVAPIPAGDEAAFLASLAIADQPARDLLTVYQGWLDRVAALEAARITGVFALHDSSAHNAQRRTALDEYARLQREAAALRAQAVVEKQISRRVDLNLELKRLDAALAELLTTL